MALRGWGAMEGVVSSAALRAGVGLLLALPVCARAQESQAPFQYDA